MSTQHAAEICSWLLVTDKVVFGHEFAFPPIYMCVWGCLVWKLVFLKISRQDKLIFLKVSRQDKLIVLKVSREDKLIFLKVSRQNKFTLRLINFKHLVCLSVTKTKLCPTIYFILFPTLKPNISWKHECCASHISPGLSSTAGYNFSVCSAHIAETRFEMR
jgi:hypothetical protein